MGMFDDPATLGLLGMSQGFAQAAMPSRMPTPTGAALGMGGAGMVQGLQQSQQLQQQEMATQQGQLNNQLQQALIPQRIALLNQQLGGSQPGSMAAPQQQSGNGGGLVGQLYHSLFGQAPSQPAQQSQPGSMAPQQQQDQMPMDGGSVAMRYLQQSEKVALASGDGRSAAQFDARLQDAANKGVVVGANGTAYPVLNSAGIAGNMAGAVSAGTSAGALPYKEQEAAFNSGLTQGNQGNQARLDVGVHAANAGFDTSQTGVRAGMTAAAEAPYKDPITTNQLGPDGLYHQVVTPRTAWASQGQQGASADLTTPQGAVAAIPDAYRTQFVNSMLANKIPTDAWPTAAAMVGQESSWNPGTHGGLGSMIPATAQGIGFNPASLNDPQTGLMAFGKYYGQQLAQNGGDPIKAAVGYNGGGDPNYAANVTRRMQAPGSSIIPGSVVGKPEFTPEQEVMQRGYGDTAKGIEDAANTAPKTLQLLDTLDNAATQFRTGATGDMRLAGQKALVDGLQAVGITPPAGLTTSAASGEAINKAGGFLASSMTRSMGSREAASVFGMIKSFNPNIEQTPEGFQVVTNSIRQGVARDTDLRDFQQQWLADPSHHGTIGASGNSPSMQQAFEQAHPVEAYASRVVPFPVPSSAAQAKPNVIYRNGQGQMAMWDGQKMIPVPAGQ